MVMLKNVTLAVEQPVMAMAKWCDAATSSQSVRVLERFQRWKTVGRPVVTTGTLLLLLGLLQL